MAANRNQNRTIFVSGSILSSIVVSSFFPFIHLCAQTDFGDWCFRVRLFGATEVTSLEELADENLWGSMWGAHESEGNLAIFVVALVAAFAAIVAPWFMQNFDKRRLVLNALLIPVLVYPFYAWISFTEPDIGVRPSWGIVTWIGASILSLLLVNSETPQYHYSEPATHRAINPYDPPAALNTPYTLGSMASPVWPVGSTGRFVLDNNQRVILALLETESGPVQIGAVSIPGNSNDTSSLAELKSRLTKFGWTVGVGDVTEATFARTQ